MTSIGSPPACGRGHILPVLPALAIDVVLTHAHRLRPAMPSTPRLNPRRMLDRPPAPSELRALTSDPTAWFAPGGAPGPAEADEALHAFTRSFYVEDERAGGHFRVHRHAWRPTTFWQTAELIELTEDAFAGTGDARCRHMIRALWRGVMLRYGPSWTAARVFNDDVIWMVLAALRLFALSGDPRCLATAKANFDSAFTRGWSDDVGGGLWWTSARREKNACVNGPAAIAAGQLSAALGDSSYLVKARLIYNWLHATLYDATSGRVGDRIVVAGNGSHTLVADASTYNQGTFIGAADMLHRLTGEAHYQSDALHALAFTRRELTVDGILRGEGNDGDGGGFKGIFARHAVRFARHNRLTDHEAWFWQNARAAWLQREGCGLILQDWTPQTGSPTISRVAAHGPAAWDASSAVVLLQVLNANRIRA